MLWFAMGSINPLICPIFPRHAINGEPLTLRGDSQTAGRQTGGNQNAHNGLRSRAARDDLTIRNMALLQRRNSHVRGPEVASVTNRGRHFKGRISIYFERRSLKGISYFIVPI